MRGFPFQLAWYEPGKQPGGEATGELLLRFPVRVGDCVGGDLDRTDGRYCWSVERRIKERGVSGWEVAYRTHPDHQLVRLVPGLGITRFTYEHHGTVASATARLVRSTPGRR